MEAHIANPKAVVGTFPSFTASLIMENVTAAKKMPAENEAMSALTRVGNLTNAEDKAPIGNAAATTSDMKIVNCRKVNDGLSRL